MNRRGFLGLLAAAPVAAPAMVKAAVAEAPRFIGGASARGISSAFAGSIHTKPLTSTVSIDASQFKIAAEEFQMSVIEHLKKANVGSLRNRTIDIMRGTDDSPSLVPDIAPTHWVQVLHDKPSRRAFDLMNPDPACIDFDKMALTLSRLPRFGGQTKEGEAIYSVLQHQVEGCYAILRDTGNRKAAAAFLIHDGHEYVIGDQVTPVQRALQAHAILLTGDLHAGEIVRDALASLRSTLDCAIYKTAGLDWPLDPETRRIVKEYDLRMCRTERDARMQPAPFSWHESIEGAEPVKGCNLAETEPDLYVRAFKKLCRDLLPAFGGAL